MPNFTYIGDTVRLYPFTTDQATNQSLVAVPNTTYALDAAPDELWTSAAPAATSQAVQTPLEAPVAPAEPTPAQTPTNAN